MAAYHIGAEISNKHLYRGGDAGLNTLHFNVNQAILLRICGAIDGRLSCVIGPRFFESIHCTGHFFTICNVTICYNGLVLISVN